MGSSILAAISRLKFVSTEGYSLRSIPSTEITNVENFTVNCGSDYHAYTSWFSSAEPGVLSLAQICRCPHQCCQVWRQLWSKSFYPIIQGRVHHFLSPIFLSSDVSPSLNFCGTGGWGVRRVQLLMGNLVKRVVGVCHTLCCSMQWRGLLCFL